MDIVLITFSHLVVVLVYVLHWCVLRSSFPAWFVVVLDVSVLLFVGGCGDININPVKSKILIQYRKF